MTKEIVVKHIAFRTSGLRLIVGGTALAMAFTAHAQETDGTSDTDYVEALKACQSIAGDAERLACFDRAVSSIVTASDSGEVQVVDKEQVEQTRRSLFGFSLPKLGIFSGDDDEGDEEKKQRANLLETSVSSVSYSRDSIFFGTPEGAVWRISNPPKRLRTVKVGDAVVLKKATMGSFFVRINGQTGVKGRRVR
jgi:hypothetical protein